MDRRGPDKESLNTFELSMPLVDVVVPDDRDIEPLYRLLQGADGKAITSMLLWDGPDSPDDIRKWVGLCRTETFGEWGYHWVLRDKEGRSVGAIGTRPRDEPGRADVGYWLGKPYWGRGIMSQALGEVMRLGFEELSYYKIQADVFAYNERGRALAEKMDMTLEGTLRQAMRKGDEFIDICIYGILYEEWLNQ